MFRPILKICLKQNGYNPDIIIFKVLEQRERLLRQNAISTLSRVVQLVGKDGKIGYEYVVRIGSYPSIGRGQIFLRGTHSPMDDRWSSFNTAYASDGIDIRRFISISLCSLEAWARDVTRPGEFSRVIKAPMREYPINPDGIYEF